MQYNWGTLSAQSSHINIIQGVIPTKIRTYFPSHSLIMCLSTTHPWLYWFDYVPQLYCTFSVVLMMCLNYTAHPSMLLTMCISCTAHALIYSVWECASIVHNILFLRVGWLYTFQNEQNIYDTFVPHILGGGGEGREGGYRIKFF